MSICIGLGLAASSGFRIFIPLLAANVASLSGLHSFGLGFEWLNGWTPFYILASASLIELVAYYIPWLDNVLDHIALPVAVAAGTLLSTSFISADWAPALRWGLGILAGGVPAGIIHSGMGLIRLGSTATTGGLGNPLVTTAENGASIGFSVLALLIPVVIAVLVVFLVIYILKKMANLARRKGSRQGEGTI
ncbi:MAG: DUF4126 domain-containing protein [Chitinophagaceae bacterium]|nr:MAG: DUF4126 domain-containing protein [Chitinophagaceae bacterium]